MYGIPQKAMEAIQGYYRFVTQRVYVCRPRGDDGDSRHAFIRAADAIRAIPKLRDADAEIEEAVEEQRRTVLYLIEIEVNHPLHPERRLDPYGWLRSTITARAAGAGVLND